MKHHLISWLQGLRIGIDYIERQLIPRMWADPGMYVVVNIPSANVNVARNLVRMLQRNEVR